MFYGLTPKSHKKGLALPCPRTRAKKRPKYATESAFETDFVSQFVEKRSAIGS